MNLDLHMLSAQERPSTAMTVSPTTRNRVDPLSAIILAGGDGKRLRSLTRAIAGDDCPKQFCRLLGENTLLEETRRRMRIAADPAATYFVLKRSDARYYEPQLAAVPRELLVVQPRERGTAIAILLALLRLPQTVRQSPVVISPSDHYVSDDAILMNHVASAAAAVHENPSRIVLLGMTPESPDTGYGWIEVGGPVGRARGLVFYGVTAFWEKPAAENARRLLDRGCLWNSFIMVGSAAAFLDLFRARSPRLFNALSRIEAPKACRDEAALNYLYERVPAIDFSRRLLSTPTSNLAVLPVSGVVWNDLGEPHRVWAARWRLGASSRGPLPLPLREAARRDEVVEPQLGWRRGLVMHPSGTSPR